MRFQLSLPFNSPLGDNISIEIKILFYLESTYLVPTLSYIPIHSLHSLIDHFSIYYKQNLSWALVVKNREAVGSNQEALLFRKLRAIH